MLFNEVLGLYSTGDYCQTWSVAGCIIDVPVLGMSELRAVDEKLIMSQCICAFYLLALGYSCLGVKGFFKDNKYPLSVLLLCLKPKLQIGYDLNSG